MDIHEGIVTLHIHESLPSPLPQCSPSTHVTRGTTLRTFGKHYYTALVHDDGANRWVGTFWQANICLPSYGQTLYRASKAWSLASRTALFDLVTALSITGGMSQPYTITLTCISHNPRCLCDRAPTSWTRGAKEKEIRSVYPNRSGISVMLPVIRYLTNLDKLILLPFDFRSFYLWLITKLI